MAAEKGGWRGMWRRDRTKRQEERIEVERMMYFNITSHKQLR